MMTINGMQSYEEVQESIKMLGDVIGSKNTGDSKIVNKCRITAMRALISLFEQYTEMMD